MYTFSMIYDEKNNTKLNFNSTKSIDFMFSNYILG